ncbi:hypothetical protein KC19_8G180000 [Ceratodon purpureus]|uniref:Secreted protein n=1 Tax=Ceratodon purpureus TaxID=3225 RepID=A0A8T0H3F9_CERPU|nr:hypothetical protein KC19_8G180000 [Ceratodon purpureus]
MWRMSSRLMNILFKLVLSRPPFLANRPPNLSTTDCFKLQQRATKGTLLLLTPTDIPILSHTRLNTLIQARRRIYARPSLT